MQYTLRKEIHSIAHQQISWIFFFTHFGWGRKTLGEGVGGVSVFLEGSMLVLNWFWGYVIGFWGYEPDYLGYVRFLRPSLNNSTTFHFNFVKSRL
jgi:hypothetical protein